MKQDILKEIEAKGIKDIKYEWVKGHQKASIFNQDARWNNYVDILAKGQKNG